MKLSRSRLQIVVDGRPVTVPGEMLVPMEGQPDFVVFSGMLKAWDDGTPISAEEKRRILEEVLGDAAVRGLRIAID